MTNCVRSIQFTLPGKSDLLVTLTEQSDGSILFDLETLGGKPADIRALFFDVQHSSILSKLKFTGSQITETQGRRRAGHRHGPGRQHQGQGAARNSTPASSSARPARARTSSRIPASCSRRPTGRR